MVANQLVFTNSLDAAAATLKTWRPATRKLDLRSSDPPMDMVWRRGHTSHSGGAILPSWWKRRSREECKEKVRELDCEHFREEWLLQDFNPLISDWAWGVLRAICVGGLVQYVINTVSHAEEGRSEIFSVKGGLVPLDIMRWVFGISASGTH